MERNELLEKLGQAQVDLFEAQDSLAVIYHAAKYECLRRPATQAAQQRVDDLQHEIRKLKTEVQYRELLGGESEMA